MKFKIVLFFSFLTALNLVAQEMSSWSHESEASIIQVSGNTTSESYSGKQKTNYRIESNILSVAGRYLQTKSSGNETAKQWEASARYEKELGNSWAMFIQHGAESDIYSGYIQRDNTDLGGKYYFMKTKEDISFMEAGVRNTKTITQTDVNYSTSGRLYLEYFRQINESVSGKIWTEYLPNFKESEAYLVNYEPSLSVMMNQIFSIKLAYLVKYHNKTATALEKKEDTTFTTALVAKF